MAQQVRVMGAVYSDVPSILLPDENNVMHHFDDTSVTTATASDVAEGKVFLAADGTITTGTASGGGTIAVVDTPDGNGGTIRTITAVDISDTTAVPSDVAYGKIFYLPNGQRTSGTASSGVGSPVPRLDVNFCDYDGTVLYSYTAEQINDSGFTMPSNPVRSGLVAQGWNWSLANLRTQLAAMPKQPIDVGQMYVTESGKTRLYCTFADSRKQPYLGICPNGTVSVDWGDGSPTETMTGTSLDTVQYLYHEYDFGGEYVISLDAVSGSFAIGGDRYGTYLLRTSSSTTQYDTSHVYTNGINRVELGSGAVLGSYAFCECNCVKVITLPTTVTNIAVRSFYDCASLLFITLPYGVTSIGDDAFAYCRSILSLTLPYGVISVGQNAFQNCYCIVVLTFPNTVTSIGNNCTRYLYNLSKFTIPSGVTVIVDYMMQGCSALRDINIPNGVTSIGVDAFAGCYGLSSITVPDSVTQIGEYAFQNCYGVAEYHFLSSTPPTLSYGVFSGISYAAGCVIYVPKNNVNSYKTATNWSDYASYIQGE